MPSTILNSFIVAAVLTAATPAFAAPTGSQQKTVLRYDAKTQKYCVKEPVMTGSLIAQTTCKTSAGWTAAGLDMPDATRVVIAQK